MKAKFGMFLLPVMQGDDCANGQSALVAAVVDAQAAERAGIDVVWVAEHHGTRYGGMCPSALSMLYFLAGRTQKVRLGTAASILPLSNPARLAEEALMLDHLSRGRVEIGVGRGFLAVDFATLGIDMNMRHALFDSGLASLLNALRCGGERALLYPPRYQCGGIPLWGAAATSRESIEQFAKAGMGLMLNPYTRTFEEVRAAIAFYRESFAAAGHAAEHARVLIHEHLFLANTEREAREIPRLYLLEYLASLRRASTQSVGGFETEHGTGPENYDSLYPRCVAFGTPRQLENRIGEWIDGGVTDFAFSFRFGGMPTPLVRQSLYLFTQVAARFRRNISSTASAEQMAVSQ